jgi:hypothetical protein
MADPGSKTHHFARPENERAVLEEFIRNHFLDLAQRHGSTQCTTPPLISSTV